ncbi:MFS transporter [Paraburkholderia sp. CNPSo 3281]|nr:MFS transporter [Paraburkholderia sp. CNPSo 3281]MCP3719232.1 MFS transporter [Paraburkholderia sp. CNPSo 3281]
MHTIAGGQSKASLQNLETRAYSKATLRLLPFLFLCYVAAYLDRVNVGFAKLQMLSDLQFSETVYGLGAGIFFIGYFFFEVPSNILMHRVGARVWIARIMITWAVLSAATLLVKTPTQFYFVRFLLGVAEAGFFPGIVLYLTYWFPAARRSRMNALFMIGIPIAGVLGGPFSGWILSAFTGTNGWTGWQWLFLIEALPSLVLGVITLFYLPTLIKASGVKSALDVGLLTAIPYACAVFSMLFVAKSADRTGERRWHFAIASLASAIGLYFSTVFGHNVPLAMLALSVGAAGMLATMPVFWTWPSAILAGGSAAAAIGMINSIGNLAGFVSPSIIGWMKDVTHSTNAGMSCVSAAMVLGAVLALLQPRKLVNG